MTDAQLAILLGGYYDRLYSALEQASADLPEHMPRHSIEDETRFHGRHVAFWPTAFEPIESLLSQLYDDMRLARQAAMGGIIEDGGLSEPIYPRKPNTPP
jgi:hypothetical protein